MAHKHLKLTDFETNEPIEIDPTTVAYLTSGIGASWIELDCGDQFLVHEDSCEIAMDIHQMTGRPIEIN